MVYNLDGLWAANNTVEMIGAVNSTSDGWLFGLLMIGLYIVLLLNINRENIRVSYLGASFIMVLLSTVAFGIGWIGLPVLIIPILLTFISLFIVLFIN